MNEIYFNYLAGLSEAYRENNSFTIHDFLKPSDGTARSFIQRVRLLSEFVSMDKKCDS